MKFCGNCGNKVEDSAKFCTSCGEIMESEVKEGNTAAVQKDSSPNTAVTSEQKDAQDNKMMGILAYIIFLIPLLAGPKDSGFVRFHTNQGLVLFITGVIWIIVYNILSSILYAISWTLGLGLGGILSVFSLVFLALAILGIINAANGSKKPLPVIGNIVILK